MEALNLAAFIAISFSSHYVAEAWDRWHQKHKPTTPSPSKHRCAVVVTIVSSVIVQPHFWHGIKEYAIHLVVYSGFVLPTH